jgi:hypothetical protein
MKHPLRVTAKGLTVQDPPPDPRQVQQAKVRAKVPASQTKAQSAVWRIHTCRT